MQKENPKRIYNYVSDVNPTYHDSPPFLPFFWLNSTTGELLSCLDNTPDLSIWKGTLGSYVSGHYEALKATFNVPDGVSFEDYVPEIGTFDPFDFENGYQYYDPIYRSEVNANEMVFYNDGTGLYFNNITSESGVAVATTSFDLEYQRSQYKWDNAYHTIYGTMFIFVGSESGDTAKFGLPGEDAVELPLTFTWLWSEDYKHRVTFADEYFRFYVDGVLQQEFHRPNQGTFGESRVGIRMGGETNDDQYVDRLDYVSLWVGGLRP